MDEAGSTRATEDRSGTQSQTTSGLGGAAGILGGLLIVAAVSFFVVILMGLLSWFGSWKAAVVGELLMVVAAVRLWKRRALEVWVRYVYVTALAVSAVFSTLVLLPTWVTQARHDVQLADMVDQLCSVELPEGANVNGCGGSISNTGNGNSCRYLATATVRGINSVYVIGTLQEQGFRPTGLDMWGDPTEDGPAYLVEGSDELRLFLQYSWRDDEGDLRCT